MLCCIISNISHTSWRGFESAVQLTEVQKKFICKNLVTTIELYYFTSFETVSKTTFSLCEGTSHVISCRKLINCLIFIFLYSCLFVFFNLLNENECKLLTLAIKIYLKKKILQICEFRNFVHTITHPWIRYFGLDLARKCSSTCGTHREDKSRLLLIYESF